MGQMVSWDVYIFLSPGIQKDQKKFLKYDIQKYSINFMIDYKLPRL